MPLLLASLALPLAGGCATTLESRSRHDLRAGEQRLSPDGGEAKRGPRRSFDGTLEGYLAYAMERSPALRATFEEWRAATHRIPQARRLPEPTFTYAFFVRRVETRVGPQRHKFGVRQALPWPTKLTAGADSASLAARSAQRRFDTAALTVARKVATAYWKLWLVEKSREVLRDQRKILQHFSSVVRGRVEVGRASLADLAQVDLRVSRITDALSALDEQERAARARLIAALGAPAGTPTPVRAEQPRLVEPAESDEALRSAAASHPRIEAMSLMAKAKREGARRAAAEHYPDLAVGLDYIETGPASMPNVPDSGKDPIIVMLSVKLPLWGGIYDSNEDEARAESAAFRAKAQAGRDDAEGELEVALSDVRDAIRRVRLYRHTLVPQAETVYASVLGGYQAGTSTIAAVLMAERDLLELELGLLRARADHAIAWARLEEIVGRAVQAREVS